MVGGGGGDATCDLLKKRVCWIIVLIPHAKFLYLTLLKFLDASSSYDISNSVKYFLLQANAQQVILEEHNNALLYLFPSHQGRGMLLVTYKKKGFLDHCSHTSCKISISYTA